MFIAFPIKARFIPNPHKHSSETILKYSSQSNVIPISDDVEGCVADNSDDAVKSLVKFVKHRLSNISDVRDEWASLNDFELIYDVTSVNNGRCWSPGAMQRTQRLTD